MVREGIPRLTTRLDDDVVGVEDAIAEVVLPRVLPDVLEGIEFRAVGGRCSRLMLFGTHRFSPV